MNIVDADFILEFAKSDSRARRCAHTRAQRRQSVRLVSERQSEARNRHGLSHFEMGEQRLVATNTHILNSIFEMALLSSKAAP